MIHDILKYTFLQNAFYSAILASIVCGIIGTIVFEKKLVMMSGGIAHTSFGGIGIAYYLGIEPILGALFFSFISAIIICTIRRKTETNSDTLIGIFWAVGMALGILFITLTPGYPPDITSYLFGDILTVTISSIKVILVLTAIIISAVTVLFNYWQVYLFDEEFLYISGINTAYLDYFLFILIAFTTVILIRVVGIVLVIALLTVPPALARLFTNRLKQMMLLAVILGVILSLSGLCISYYFNIPSGAAIILLTATVYFSILGLNLYNRKFYREE